MRKISQTNSTPIRKKCVKLAKMIVKHTKNYTCERCGKSMENGYKMDGAHILPEGKYISLSAETINILVLCTSCHTLGKDSWHENPLLAIEWFEGKYPERSKKLKELSKLNIHMGKYEWQKKYEELKEEYAKILQ